MFCADQVTNTIPSVARKTSMHAASMSVSLGWSTDRKSTCLNSSHLGISYAVFCLKKKKTMTIGGLRMQGNFDIEFLPGTRRQTTRSESILLKIPALILYSISYSVLACGHTAGMLR